METVEVLLEGPPQPESEAGTPPRESRTSLRGLSSLRWKAGVSMVGSQGSPPFCTGDLELRAAGARLRGGVLRSHGWAGF